MAWGRASMLVARGDLGVAMVEVHFRHSYRGGSWVWLDCSRIVRGAGRRAGESSALPTGGSCVDQFYGSLQIISFSWNFPTPGCSLLHVYSRVCEWHSVHLS